MQWIDRVYGPVSLDDPDLEALIACPTFQRLAGIRQAGPSALAFDFKDVTRLEHSLGVFILLRRLGADPREQLAGLLHDISHTAFSHAVDFLYTSEEQAHHEELKPLFLNQPDLAAALERLGHRPQEFYDDSVYPLLERPIPNLCADRVDYFLRDGLACRVCSRHDVLAILASLVVVDQTIAFEDPNAARLARDLFATMNRDWWASPTEAFIYNEFGQILLRAIQRGYLHPDDLLGQDDQVLSALDASDDPDLLRRLRQITHFAPQHLEGYQAAINPKERWLDPAVRVGSRAIPLSRLESRENSL